MFKAVERPFTILSMAYPLTQNFTANYIFDGERHDFIEMVFVSGGNAEIAENDKIYLLNDGNMIFHAPMEFHRIKSADGTTPTVFNLSLKIGGDVPKELYDGVFTLNKSEQDEFLSIHSAAKSFISSPEDDSDYTGALTAHRLEAFIISICKRNNKSNSLSSEAGALTYNKLAKTMREHIYDGISLSELAKLNYISVSYVKALFYRYTGASPGIYYAKLRINEAASLMSEGIPIARISEMMNFSSPNYFSAFFKKHTGKTPSEYRKQTGAR